MKLFYIDFWTVEYPQITYIYEVTINIYWLPTSLLLNYVYYLSKGPKLTNDPKTLDTLPNFKYMGILPIRVRINSNGRENMVK